MDGGGEGEVGGTYKQNGAKKPENRAKKMQIDGIHIYGERKMDENGDKRR